MDGSEAPPAQQIDVSVQHTQISILAALERAEHRVTKLG
jgi:hypothetical protein